MVLGGDDQCGGAQVGEYTELPVVKVTPVSPIAILGERDRLTEAGLAPLYV
jgi:hypothetical protein